MQDCEDRPKKLGPAASVKSVLSVKFDGLNAIMSPDLTDFASFRSFQGTRLPGTAAASAAPRETCPRVRVGTCAQSPVSKFGREHLRWRCQTPKIAQVAQQHRMLRASSDSSSPWQRPAVAPRRFIRGTWPGKTVPLPGCRCCWGRSGPACQIFAQQVIVCVESH